MKTCASQYLTIMVKSGLAIASPDRPGFSGPANEEIQMEIVTKKLLHAERKRKENQVLTLAKITK